MYPTQIAHRQDELVSHTPPPYRPLRGGNVSEVFDIADRYCTQLGALDPCSATGAGIPGHDHEMTDYSPEGSARRNDLARATLAALVSAANESDDDRLAASVITERLSLDLDQFDAGERL